MSNLETDKPVMENKNYAEVFTTTSETCKQPKKRGRPRKSVDKEISMTINQVQGKSEGIQTSPDPDNHTNDVQSHVKSVATLRKRKIPRQQLTQQPTPMPNNEILEFVLTKLQERDTWNLFAEPVNGDKVEGYYELIKNPMDFGTIRKNLLDGFYKSLDQFEHDVLAIFKNAMEYNSKRFINFGQARQINELAKKYFRKLNTNPNKVVEEFLQDKANKITGTGKGLITRTKRETRTKGERNHRAQGLSISTDERRDTGKALIIPEPKVFTPNMSSGANETQLVLTAAAMQNMVATTGNKSLLNTIAQRGTNPSAISPRIETHYGYQGSSSFITGSTNDKGKQKISEMFFDLNKQIPQPQTTLFPSTAYPSSLEFLTRDGRQLRVASQAPPRMINPSRLSQYNSFPFEAVKSGEGALMQVQQQFQSSYVPASMFGQFPPAVGPTPVNNSIVNKNTSSSPCLTNPDGTRFSFMKLLTNEYAGNEEIMQQQHSMSPSVTEMKPQGSSFSFMKLLMGDADHVAECERALAEEFKKNNDN